MRGNVVRIVPQMSTLTATPNPIVSIPEVSAQSAATKKIRPVSTTILIRRGMDVIGKKFAGTAARSIDWGTSHGSYSYGDWEYYSTSQHRRYGTCDDCGGGGKYEYGRHSTSTEYYEYNETQHTVEKYCSVCNSDVGSATKQNHSLKYGSWENDSDTQHRRSATCSLCGYSGYAYANHSFKNGSWINYSDAQHRRTKSCSTCSTSDYEYAGHSFTYGKWSSVSDTQHKRTKTCSVCKASSEEYADHVDSNGDGKCDDCSATVSLTVTWDAGSNGGSIDGKADIQRNRPAEQQADGAGQRSRQDRLHFQGLVYGQDGRQPLQYGHDHQQHDILRAV